MKGEEMGTLLILGVEFGAGRVPVAHRARLRERVVARVRTSSLDTKLASGASPDARPELSLRSAALEAPCERAKLVRRLRDVLDGARGGARPMHARVAFAADGVLAAASELEALIVRLLEPGPVEARGIAQVRLLLTDGRSPLYFAEAVPDLPGAVAAALAALEPKFEL